MKNFSYFRPTTEESAIALLDKTWGTTELLAGGDNTKKGPDPADLAVSGPFSSDRQLS